MTVLNIRNAATVAHPRLDREAVFLDKRVIPPFPRQEGRIGGTLHLPGSSRRSDRPGDAAAV